MVWNVSVLLPPALLPSSCQSHKHHACKGVHVCPCPFHVLKVVFWNGGGVRQAKKQVPAQGENLGVECLPWHTRAWERKPAGKMSHVKRVCVLCSGEGRYEVHMLSVPVSNHNEEEHAYTCLLREESVNRNGIYRICQVCLGSACHVTHAAWPCHAHELFIPQGRHR